MGIAKDRAFHTEEIRKIYEKTGNLMGKAEESTGSLRTQSDSLQTLLGVLESGLPSPGLRASDIRIKQQPAKNKGNLYGLCQSSEGRPPAYQREDQPRGCRDRKESFRSRIRYWEKQSKGRKSLRNLSGKSRAGELPCI